MTSFNRPLENRPLEHVEERVNPVVTTSYHDQVRWGPIVAGLVIALSTQLVLSALGAAIGFSSIGGSGAPRSEAVGVGINIGIWSIISLLLSLFVGGWIVARSSGRTNRNTTLLNGAILWASMLTLSAWLLSSGVTGAFGIVAANATDMVNPVVQQSRPSGVAGNSTTLTIPGSTPTLTAQQTRDLAGNAAKISWSFVFGSLLGLVAALLGSTTGFRYPRMRDQSSSMH